MVLSNNPLMFLMVFAFFVAGLVVYPFIKTEDLRITPAKIGAVIIVLCICVFFANIVFFLVFLWPLSFIWFPEHWGNYTGFLRGHYIDQKTPPVLIAAMGWFFLVVFPLLVLWITGREL